MSKPVALPNFHPVALPDLEWVKGSASNTQHLDDCIAVAALGDTQVAIADTKDEDATPLAFRRSEFAAFVASAKAGEFDHLA